MSSRTRRALALALLAGACGAGIGPCAAAPAAGPAAAQAPPERAPDLVLPVPAVTIYPGDMIKETMLREQSFPPTFRARAAVIDAPLAIVGRVARRTLLPGEPVPVNAVDDPRLVSRGTPTTMIFEENGLIITTLGTPLQNGGLGEVIRVRNTDTGRIVVGVVQGDGRIRIGDMR
ncbi:flagellar basal body P-ring formation chaperone FlgA [Methylobacterium sp. CB376]|nr:MULTISPECIES: flagellar basal body P-ring formation chaperone FlgA [Methylobacterium]WFT77359.1 flagellar basal body P-ring formation chaperone FlgA [Methylobacterium nodulans]